MARTIICKIMVGSHLYGTNGPNSDKDYFGVFLPSRADLLALKPYPTEMIENVKVSVGPRNSAADVDCKYFALSKFMTLAAEGQPGQLELLFARESHHMEPPTQEWQEIVARRSMFLSRRSIVPFIRFAEAQAHKAVIKGENLDSILRLLAWSQTVEARTLGRSIREHVQEGGAIGPIAFKTFVNASGAELIEIAGRAFDVATPVKRFIEAIAQLEKRYGSRSRSAAIRGVDWKSIHHALRLTFEAEDLLRDGEIRLPFTGDRLDFLRKIKAGAWPDFDWSRTLQERIALVNERVATSQLPESIDFEAIERLHAEIVENSLLKRANRQSDRP